MARNRCKKVLNDATKSRISSKKLCFCDFWKIFNNVLNKSKSTVPHLIHDSDVLTSSKDKAELLAQNFSSNSFLDATGHALSVFPSRCDFSLGKVIITSTFVAKAISNLDPSTSSGPDNIPLTILQRCSPELSTILSKLFNKCLAESSLPSSWKTTSVVPIFKNFGDRSYPLNYRPISLLNIISKAFESLIDKALVSHMEFNSLFSDTQYGIGSVTV